MSSMDNIKVNRGGADCTISSERKMTDESVRESKELPKTMLKVALASIIIGGLILSCIWLSHAVYRPPFFNGPALLPTAFTLKLTYIIGGSFGGLALCCVISALALKVLEKRVAASIKKNLDPAEFFQDKEVDIVLKALKSTAYIDYKNTNNIDSGKLYLPQSIYERHAKIRSSSSGSEHVDYHVRGYDVRREETWAPLVRYGFIAKGMVDTILSILKNMNAHGEVQKQARGEQEEAQKAMLSEYTKHERLIKAREQGNELTNPEMLNAYDQAKARYDAIKMPELRTFADFTPGRLSRFEFKEQLVKNCALERGVEDAKEMKTVQPQE